MAGVNKVILVGRLGKDPEVRHLESGAAVANFTMATSESYKDKNTGQRVEQTEWHNIVLWRWLAETAEKYLHKGDMVYIEGKLKTRSWQDKDGNTRYTTEVVADNMTMLGKRSDGDQSNAAPATTTAQNSGVAAAPGSTQGASDISSEGEMDDLPF